MTMRQKAGHGVWAHQAERKAGWALGQHTEVDPSMAPLCTAHICPAHVKSQAR